MVDSKNAQCISRDHENRIIQIKLNPMDYNSFMLFESTLKTDFFRFQASRPRKPRTTGEKSQNHHINGHVQQICVETGNSFHDVKMAVKMMAVEMGYPFRTIVGNVIPYSETEADTIQAAILIEASHIIAAELNINLKED